MGEKMTLEEVRNHLLERKAAMDCIHKGTRFDAIALRISEEYQACVDAIDAHLATPAQTVDVEFEVTG